MILRYCPFIFRGSLENTAKYFSHCSRSVDREVNVGPPKIEVVDNVFHSNIICFYTCLNESGIIELNNLLHTVYPLMPVSYVVSKKREK